MALTHHHVLAHMSFSHHQIALAPTTAIESLKLPPAALAFPTKPNHHLTLIPCRLPNTQYHLTLNLKDMSENVEEVMIHIFQHGDKEGKAEPLCGSKCIWLIHTHVCKQSTRVIDQISLAPTTAIESLNFPLAALAFTAKPNHHLTLKPCRLLSTQLGYKEGKAEPYAGANATGRYIPMFANKAQVIDQIRERSYEETLMILELIPYQACDPILKFVYSARQMLVTT
ncbi:50S ribosomal protein L22, chloroplastic-like [Fagus crenata]